LDPEQTGLRDYIESVLRYAHINESDAEFYKYQARVYISLEELAKEYRRERQAIARGKSLESLISERKKKLDKENQQFINALTAIKDYFDKKSDLISTLDIVEKSNIRFTRLATVVNILVSDKNKETFIPYKFIRDKFVELGWMNKNQEGEYN
jgi:hypothetical protein